MTQRACPACTLIAVSPTALVCELCGAALPAPLKRPAPQRLDTKQKKQKKPDAKQRPIASFFRSPSPATAATSPAAPAAMPASPPAPSASPEAPDTSLMAATPPMSPPTAPAVQPLSPAVRPDAAPEVPPPALPPAAAAPTRPSAEILALPLAEYTPSAAGWKHGGAVPYAHVAATLDALADTRSRLAKERILTNAFRACLALQTPPAELEAVCYLLAPMKDPQSGGHRICPSWSAASAPLGITSAAITAAVVEATGTSKAQLSAAYRRLRDLGDAALAVKEGEGRGRQTLLRAPPPLTAGHVHATLLGLARLSGTGVEGRRAARMAALLRAGSGREVRWLVRTFIPHMSGVGISLEASVLPALGQASHTETGAAKALPPGAGASVTPAVDAAGAGRLMRTCYALRPDVRAVCDALCSGGLAAVPATCVLTPGVPPQPMLAKPTTSAASLIAAALAEAAAVPAADCVNDAPPSTDAAAPEAPILAAAAAAAAADAAAAAGDGFVVVGAEHKYDGQRAQVHRLPDGSLRIFSRKLDLMTSKYPDVEAAVTRACASATLPFIIDAEIVPIAGPPPGPGADPGTAGGEGPALATFQTLSTRKRKDVTEANAAAKGTAVQLILFDLLALGATSLISRPLRERRAALHRLFEPVRDAVAFVKNTDVRLPVAAAVPRDRDQGDGDAAAAAAPGPDAEVQMEGALRAAVAAGCEGLMVKLLDGPASAYDPSTRRSGAWLKLKKDYVDGMGDSLDLIPIGGWRGQGRKQRWISPWLMATYDPIEGTLGSVCRVMSGFTDAVYRENTIKYMGREFSVGGDEGAEAEDGAGDEEDADNGEQDEDPDDEDLEGDGDGDDDDGGGDGEGLLLGAPADGVETGERCAYWFRPCEVWEVRGADVTLSPVHMAAAGLVHPQRGLSIRFPRFMGKRSDKTLRQATTPQELAALFKKQAQGQDAI